MLRYTLNRLLLMIPTVLGVVVLIYVMLQILPAMWWRWSSGTRHCLQEVIQAERQRLGLDRH
jgi:peptide/nickel transport system permease protein